MGLLRKAATAASRDSTAELTPTAAPREPEEVPTPGLLKKSAHVRESVPTPPATDNVLSVELAPESVESVVAVPLEEEILELEAVDETGPVLVEEAAPDAPTPAATLEEHVPAALPPQAPPLEQIIDGILLDINELADGVELPSRMFSRIAARLGITKGALLLYDALRLVYAPWASAGYDQTTLHRLRIPLGANTSFNALANGVPLFLSDPKDREGYQHYFSSRELSGMNRLILAPFIAEGALVAVLLVSEISSPFATDEELLACLSRVVAAGAPRIHAARTEKLAATAPTPAAATPADEMTRFVSALSASSAPTLLMTLSVEDYAAAVIGAHEHLDPFRLQEDIAYFLGSFLSDVGKLMPVRKGVFVVALSEFPSSDTDLFLHQLTQFLHGLFGAGAGEAPSPRILKTQSWPSNGGDIRNVIETLSS